MLVPNRHANTSNYRYGFNGMESDNEIKGEGNSYDFGARMYDPRVGRWFSVDPLAEQAPDWTPYRYGFNNPIRYIDPTGMFEADGLDNEYKIFKRGGQEVDRQLVSTRGGNEIDFITEVDLDKVDKLDPSAE